MIRVKACQASGTTGQSAATKGLCPRVQHTSVPTKSKPVAFCFFSSLLLGTNNSVFTNILKCKINKLKIKATFAYLYRSCGKQAMYGVDVTHVILPETVKQ